MKRRIPWYILIRLLQLISRHRFFLSVLMVLGLMWLGYSYSIRWLKNHAAEVTALQAEAATVDMQKEPGRYVNIQRTLAFTELEPFFYALLMCIPASFLLVLIVCIYKARGDGRQHEPTTKEEIEAMRARVAQKKSSGR